MTTSTFQPFIVGIGGTLRSGSSSEKALTLALSICRQFGASTEAFVGPNIELQMYGPEVSTRQLPAERLVAALRRAHGVIVASPGYHGSISGLLKNALDYAEDLSRDDPPYLGNRAVGLIACALGTQASVMTLTTMRSIVHALRAWPTPMGVALNTAGSPFDGDGRLSDAAAHAQIEILARQVVDFALMRAQLCTQKSISSR